ncbi:hypothetical protein [Alkalidesulfovibrio alkalitolerans]|uniref:hypothetical protein n=1 Tax=Alkalidesulfovibrio alkalitolerans TaxID=293256 RepID=UPI001378844A|nr:hypothetical protein [Alkalidesulfovibrio alkalitolerans]
MQEKPPSSPPEFDAEDLHYFFFPFKNSASYIQMIVLDNCLEYFEEYERLCERGGSTQNLGRRLLRKLFNAVESLNNIPDYMLFDKNIPEHKMCEIKKKIISECPEMNIIFDLANAYKHCVRGKKKGGQLVIDKNKKSIREMFPKNESSEEIYSFDATEYHNALKSCWSFWIKNTQDGKHLLFKEGEHPSF